MNNSYNLSADELEIRIKERTAELEKSNRVLRAEVLERKLVENELTKTREKLEAEIRGIGILHRLSTRHTEGDRDLSSILQEMIEVAIAITGADKGSIQVLNPLDGKLRIVTQRGFDHPALESLESLDLEETDSYKTAVERMESVIVEDITQSSIFKGSNSLSLLKNEGIRAVLLTPLFSRSGELLGFNSVFFGQIHMPVEHELILIDILARQVADIIEWKLSEESLHHIEQPIRIKSDTIVSPSGETVDLKLSEIVDAQAIQSLMDDFNKLTHISVGLNDLNGNVLANAGWQDICTKFHRIHPEACKHCIESDINLSCGIVPGEFKLYRCKNNMWDISTPVMVGGQQVGILFIGQFFFDDEPLDYELFRSQARKYGFNEEEYIAALEKVPRLNRETVETSTTFLMKLANMISQINYSNIKLAHSLAERDCLIDALRESEKRERARSDELAAVLDSVPAAVWIAHDPKALHITGNRLSCEWLHTPRSTNFSKSAPEGERPEMFRLIKEGVEIPPEDMPLQMSAAGTDLNDYEIDIISDGKIRHLLGNARPMRDERGNPYGSVSAFIDITERKRIEQEREMTVAFLRLVNESKGTDELVHSAVSFFRERSGLEAVGIRINEGGDFPYFESCGFSEEFVRMENSLCARDETGQTICDNTGNPILECMCGNVICGRFDTSKPFFTDRGSFWTSSTTELLTGTTDADRQARTRNRCNGEGYESVALIALRVGRETLGLLQLNDRRKGQFSSETIAMWERLADYLAVALAKARAEEKLRAAYGNLQVQSEELQVQSEELQAKSKDLMETNKALQESEDRFRSVLENSLDAAYRRDLQADNYDYLSPVIEQLTGFSAREMSAISINEALDHMHPDDRSLVAAELTRALAEGMGTFEYRFQCKDGKYRWLADYFKVIKDRNGSPRFISGVVRDITERKRVEDTLAFERSQLLSIFDGIDDVVYVADPYTYEVLYANKAMKEKFGGELVGGICYREFQRRDSPCDFCTNPIILKERDKPYHWEYYNPMVDRYFMIMDRIIKWPDGRDVRFEIAKDITERKRAEEALRLSNLYNRSLIEASLDPLVTIGHDGKIKDVNGATEQVTGYSRDDLIGTDFSDYFTEPENARKGYQRVFIEGKVWDYPLEIHHKDGHITPVLYNASVYRDENGEVIGVFAAARDITERKKAEAALRKVHDNLENLVEERTEQLEKAYNSLKESEKGLAEAQRMAHIGNWRWDITTNELLWSDEVYRIFGLNSRELKVTYDLFLNFVHPDDRNYLIDAITEGLKGSPLDVEYRIVLS